MIPTVSRNRQPLDADHPLVRAVTISLFTWRRAGDHDPVEGLERHGWWGDSVPSVDGDRIGSRLWLLQREKLTDPVLRKAEDYAREALQWLLDDGLAASVSAVASRQGLDTLVLRISVTEADGAQWDIAYPQPWSATHGH